MNKIINLNNPNIQKPKENNPTELLDVFIASTKENVEMMELIVDASKRFGEIAAKECGLDFNLFQVKESSADNFVHTMARRIVTPLFYEYTDEEGVYYEIGISIQAPTEDGTYGEYSMSKVENRKIFDFDYKEEKWFEREDDFDEFENDIEDNEGGKIKYPRFEELIESEAPESEIAELLSGAFTFDEYLEIKKNNGPFFELFNLVHGYMDPDFEEFSTDTGENVVVLSVVPKETWIFGFKLRYENGSFSLCQVIDSLELLSLPGLEHIEYNNSLMNRETYFHEVGTTADIKEAARILRELADHYITEDVGIVPLSLNAYMKVSEFAPPVYKICHIDGTDAPMTAAEKRCRDKAVKELLVYER